MGGGASKNNGSKTDGSNGTQEKLWVEEKTFAAENSLVYASSPLYHELRNMLGEPLGQRCLGEYAKSENSAENFFAWIDMEEYKEIPTKDYRRFVARNIFQKYIKPGAVMQLGGVTDERIKHYEDLIYEEGEIAQSTTGLVKTSRGKLDLKPEVFVGLQHMVFREMAENTFKRFKDSDKYKEYLEEKKKTYNAVDVDDFEYLSFLGQGAFGAVAHVRKKSTGKEYAMKVMNKAKLLRTIGRKGTFKERKEKINIERDVYANSQFPFIVGMHYAFQTEKDAIIVMEFARGGTLHNLIQAFPDGRLPEDAVRFITAELMLALRHLHCSNYVHRDLKPINVLLDSRGHVKLADMGLVARIDDTKNVVKRLHSEAVLQSDLDDLDADGEEEDIAPLEQNGNPEVEEFKGRRYTRVGTMGYKAPELLAAKRPRKESSNGKSEKEIESRDRLYDAHNHDPVEKAYGASVDWWSLGVMVLEMFVGKNVFCPKSAQVIAAQDPEKVEFNTIQSVKNPSEQMTKASADAKSFVEGLLERDHAKRLGCDDRGFRGIQNHPWFADLNLSKLLSKELPPPYNMNHIFHSPLTRKWSSFAEMRAEVDAMDLNALMGEVREDSIQKKHQRFFEDWDYVAAGTFKLELGAQKERLSTAHLDTSGHDHEKTE